jgi:hypothetical protein
MKNWKTTSAGILMMLGAIETVYFHVGPITQELVMGASTAFLGGIGLIVAKDNNVTGGNIEQ